MNFTKSYCQHNKFEKCALSIYSCKECSTTQLISLPILLKKKSNEVFDKPREFCFNYEINIIKLIINQIYNDEINFINYKQDLDKLNNDKTNFFLNDKDKSDNNDNESFHSEKDNESYNDSSYHSDKSNNEEDFLYSFNIYYNNRNEIYSYIKDLCNNYNTNENCFYLTMTLIEEFYKYFGYKHINAYQMDLIMNAIFILAYKFDDTDCEIYICNRAFKTHFCKERKHLKPKDLKIAEVQCLEILKYNLNKLTIYNFLELVLSAGVVLEKEINNFNVVSKIYKDCLNLLEFCFRENDLIIEHSMSEIVFSIIYLVRKQNNLIYNIGKIFNKIYNIELKNYINCIKYISSIYYKNENISNNLFLINDERKKYLLKNQKDSINEDKKVESMIIENKNPLNPIDKKNENEKIIVSNSYNNNEICNNICQNIHSNNNMKKIPFPFSKSKSLDIKEIKKLENIFKKKSKENLNNKNSILFESSCIPKIKDIEKSSLKPIKLNILRYSRNLSNYRYKNAINNNSSISTFHNSNNNEIKNKLTKNSSNISSMNINKRNSNNLYYIKDNSNNNNSQNTNIKINKVNSCKNILDQKSYFNFNNASKYNKNLINSFRKSLLNKSELNNQFYEDLSAKVRLDYFLNKKNENNKSKEGKKNIDKIINQMYDNINKGKIKLPLIKKFKFSD